MRGPELGVPRNPEDTLRAFRTLELWLSQLIPDDAPIDRPWVLVREVDGLIRQYALATSPGGASVSLDTGAKQVVFGSRSFNVMDYGTKADGVTDDTAAVQAAINAAVAAGRGLIVFPNGVYLIAGTLTLNPTAVPSGDFEFDLRAATIHYTGANYLFDFNATGTSDIASRILVHRGRIILTSNTVGCFKITDCGAGIYYGQNITGGDNAILYHIRNDDAYSENNSILHLQAATFRTILKTEVIGAAATSFARTVCQNIKGSGGQAGYPWFELNGSVYDSTFHIIKGNVTNGVSAILAFYGTHGGTLVQGVDVESGGGYYGFHIDPGATNAPAILHYDVRHATDEFTPTSTFTNESKIKVFPGFTRVAPATRVLIGPFVYSVDPFADNHLLTAAVGAGDGTIILPSISKMFKGIEFRFRCTSANQNGKLILTCDGADTLEGGATTLNLYPGQSLTMTWRGSGTTWHPVDWFGISEHLVDGWYYNDAAASLVDQVMTRLATTTDNPNAWVVSRPGWLTSLAIHSNDARTAGTLTVKVFVNGVAVAGFVATLDGTNTTFARIFQYIGTTVLAAGDLVDVRVSTGPAWTPITADIRATVGITS